MKRLVYSIACIMLIIVLLYLSICGYRENYASTKNISYEVYIVKPGDTLWSIANGIDTNKDVREVICEIRKINNTDAVIYPGQEIKIPIY